MDPLILKSRILKRKPNPTNSASPPRRRRKVAPSNRLHLAHRQLSAFFTPAETHLRKREFVHPTETDLNLGDSDWTVEFWFKSNGESRNEGTVFEIGQGPRGENDRVTALRVSPRENQFRLIHFPTETDLVIPSRSEALVSEDWHHYAFGYDANAQRLHHWVDGVQVEKSVAVQMKPLEMAKRTISLLEETLSGTDLSRERSTNSVFPKASYIPPIDQRLRGLFLGTTRMIVRFPN